MNLTNKNQLVVQQEIDAAVASGQSVDQIKQELRAAGLIPEGFFFSKNVLEGNEYDYVPETEEQLDEEKEMSVGEIVWTIILIVLTLFPIARCSRGM